MKEKTATKIIYILIILSLILMIYNISELDFNDLSKGPLLGLISNIFLIIAMIITLRERRLNKK